MGILKAGFEEIDRIEMFYEVVGTRKFWMLEYVLRNKSLKILPSFETVPMMLGGCTLTE